MTRSEPAEEEGFTIIEVVVVVAILSILSTIAIATFGGFYDKALYTVAQSSLNDIFKQCRVGGDPEMPSGIAQATFSKAGSGPICAEKISAKRDGCWEISIDNKTGEKTSLTQAQGWPNDPAAYSCKGTNATEEQSPIISVNMNPFGYKLGPNNVLLEEPQPPYTVCATSADNQLKPWEACKGTQPCNSAGQPVMTGGSGCEQDNKCKQLNGLSPNSCTTSPPIEEVETTPSKSKFKPPGKCLAMTPACMGDVAYCNYAPSSDYCKNLGLGKFTVK